MKQHLLEYYQAKKSLIEAKRKQLADHNLKQQVQHLRSQFLERQRQWKSLTAAYVQ